MKIAKIKPYQQKLKAHKQSILKLYSPQGLDGNLLYSLSMGGELMIWDLYQKKLKHQFTLQFPHLKQTKISQKRICYAQFYHNIVYTGLFDGKVYSWSIHTGELIDKFESHKQQIQSIKKISNTVLITAGNDGVVNLWDTVSGNLDKSFIFEGRPQLAVISNRKTISIINLHSSSMVKKIETKIGRCIIKVFEENNLLLIQMSDNILECYKNISDDQPIWKIFVQGTWVNSIICIGQILMFGCEDASLRMFSLKSHQIVDVVTQGHYSSINTLGLAFGKLFSGSSDCYVLEWNIEEFHHRLREKKMMAIQELESIKHQMYMKVLNKKEKKSKKGRMSKSKSKTKKVKTGKSTK